MVGCGPGADTCSDVDCVMTHLQLNLDGNALSLTPLPADRVPAPASGPLVAMGALQLMVVPLSSTSKMEPVARMQAGIAAVAGAATAPAITNAPGPLTLASTSDVESFELDWTDPIGARPAFCLIPWDADAQRPYPHCVYCIVADADGKTAGQSIFNATATKPIGNGKIDFGYGAASPNACRANGVPMQGDLQAGTPAPLGFNPPGATPPATHSPCSDPVPAGKCKSDHLPDYCTIGSVTVTSGPQTGSYSTCSLDPGPQPAQQVSITAGNLGGDGNASLSIIAPNSGGAVMCSRVGGLSIDYSNFGTPGYTYQASSGMPVPVSGTYDSCPDPGNDPGCQSCTFTPTTATPTHWAGTITAHATNTDCYNNPSKCADITVKVDVAQYKY
jgi:hypothetical protein